jgi:cytochrome c-type biogenesis protein CcmH/NrfG
MAWRLANHLDSAPERTSIRDRKATRKWPRGPLSSVMTYQRNRRAPNPGHCILPGLLRWNRVVLCVLAVVVPIVPLRAQKTRYTPNFGAAGKPQLSVVRGSTFDTNSTTDEEKCFPWRFPATRSTTVSVTRLKVPSNVRREYEKACNASNRNKFEEAEQHARSAVDQFQEYSAAWVMLGVILEEQHKTQEARNACARAATIDATYLPAYLCAAEVAVRNREWQEVLSSADLALGVQSEGDPYAFYYRAMACLYMNNPVEAKKSALQAAAIDVNHDEPLLNFLLAKIYEREGNSAEAIAQLQQFLKHPANRQQEDAAKQFLAKLESQQPAK